MKKILSIFAILSMHYTYVKADEININSSRVPAAAVEETYSLTSAELEEIQNLQGSIKSYINQLRALKLQLSAHDQVEGLVSSLTQTLYVAELNVIAFSDDIEGLQMLKQDLEEMISTVNQSLSVQ
ncbi:MAG: hypothetical protein ACK41T_09800 [Pseudobdellovibrio sp.]